MQHREYIAQNPVKAGLVDSSEKFPYWFTYLTTKKAAGAKSLYCRRSSRLSAGSMSRL